MTKPHNQQQNPGQRSDAAPSAQLIEPSEQGWVLIAVPTDRHLPICLPFTKAQRSAWDAARKIREFLAQVPEVLDVVQLAAVMEAPGRTKRATRRKWDHVVLARTADLASAQTVARAAALSRRPPRGALITAARNVRRIADVPHTSGVYLLNYFTGPDVATTLDVWQYTAGWFQRNTGLTNSTVLEPTGPTPYTVINHCQWRHWTPLLLHLTTRGSFRTFVLHSFKEAQVAPHPVLYRLVE